LPAGEINSDDVLAARSGGRYCQCQRANAKRDGMINYVISLHFIIFDFDLWFGHLNSQLQQNNVPAHVYMAGKAGMNGTQCLQ